MHIRIFVLIVLSGWFFGDRPDGEASFEEDEAKEKVPGDEIVITGDHHQSGLVKGVAIDDLPNDRPLEEDHATQKDSQSPVVQ